MASGRSYTTAFKTKAETQGIDEMQKKLQGLQKSLRDNQAEQKSLSKEIKDAEVNCIKHCKRCDIDCKHIP